MGQAREEGCGRNLFGRLPLPMGEAVILRCADAEAGEVKTDHPVQPRLVGQVGAREVVRGLGRAQARAGKVGAAERPLRRRVKLVARDWR